MLSECSFEYNEFTSDVLPFNSGSYIIACISTDPWQQPLCLRYIDNIGNTYRLGPARHNGAAYATIKNKESKYIFKFGKVYFLK